MERCRYRKISPADQKIQELLGNLGHRWQDILNCRPTNPNPDDPIKESFIDFVRIEYLDLMCKRWVDLRSRDDDRFCLEMTTLTKLFLDGAIAPYEPLTRYFHIWNTWLQNPGGRSRPTTHGRPKMNNALLRIVGLERDGQGSIKTDAWKTLKESIHTLTGGKDHTRIMFLKSQVNGDVKEDIKSLWEMELLPEMRELVDGNSSRFEQLKTRLEEGNAETATGGRTDNNAYHDFTPIGGALYERLNINNAIDPSVESPGLIVEPAYHSGGPYSRTESEINLAASHTMAPTNISSTPIVEGRSGFVNDQNQPYSNPYSNGPGLIPGFLDPAHPFGVCYHWTVEASNRSASHTMALPNIPRMPIVERSSGSANNQGQSHSNPRTCGGSQRFGGSPRSLKPRPQELDAAAAASSRRYHRSGPSQS